RRLVGRFLAVEDEQLADRLDRRGAEFVDDAVANRHAGVAVVSGHADLDQFVRREAAIDFGEDAGRQARFADDDDGVEGVRLRLGLSDMAPNLSGVGLADAARMQHVIELAADFAVRFLKPQGALLVKAFHGSGYSQIVEALKRDFTTVAPRKPKASRDRSSET